MAAKKVYVNETPEQKQERLRKYHAEYYQAHKEEIIRRVDEWRKANRHLAVRYDYLYQRKYYQEHRDAIRAKRNAQRRSKLVHGLLIREKADLFDILMDAGIITEEMVKQYEGGLKHD